MKLSDVARADLLAGLERVREQMSPPLAPEALADYVDAVLDDYGPAALEGAPVAWPGVDDTPGQVPDAGARADLQGSEQSEDEGGERCALPADAWGLLALPWRAVTVGDVLIVGEAPDQQAWSVVSVGEWKGVWTAVARRGGGQHRAEVDPDAQVTILVPLAEREAIRTARSDLGAVVIARSVPETDG